MFKGCIALTSLKIQLKQERNKKGELQNELQRWFSGVIRRPRCRYPTIISNASLYKKCREAPLSMQVLEARWRLFGRVLRRDRNIPANKAMLFYFPDNKRARGRPQTTLPITLNNDIKKLVATKLELTTQTDLDTLCLIAEDRPKWNALVAEIRKTAEAARSDDPASGRL
ncbi:endonuclease-reverse transcriptase [Plakobranchus ocellatus]|uniref:Endonuclease-reverse transcriptase n=1 Tax=Plakobranchus ocellatus TaxID=259542 RepID=A0AAV3ZVA0_9GAST|nr:endonuclease-reverse transcriptase [Plakobranchus ocellatus]